MPRIVCPACGAPDRLADRDLGREVECRRCRAAFFAEAALPPADEDRPATRTDGSGFATWSLLLGLGSVFTSWVCGAGIVFGLGGLLTGFGSLQSRRRGVGITGLVLSLTGTLLSLGMMAVVIGALSAIQRPVPAKPDGTQPPFSRFPN